MTLELPLLRLGLAGFSAEQQKLARAAVEAAAPPAAGWALGPLAEADAWWINGARTLPMSDGTLRIGSGAPAGHAMQLNPAGMNRPLAFSRPLPPPPFEAACSFELADKRQCVGVIERFTAWLRPMLAQFSLASCIIEHQAALGGGAFEVLLDGLLIAVVDMRGDVGVLPTAGPGDLEEALWRRAAAVRPEIPAHFARISMSQLMWSFAMRTQRDVLPPHYRTGLIYYRRPPRLPQRALRDSHLLVMRELAGGSGTLDELGLRTGMAEAELVRDLGALYLVGAITSNRKRAAQGALCRVELSDSILSGPHSVGNHSRARGAAPRRPFASDLTVPASLSP